MVTVSKYNGDTFFINENEYINLSFLKDEKKFIAQPIQPTAHIGVFCETIEIDDVMEVLYTNEAHPTVLKYNTISIKVDEPEKRQDGVFVKNIVDLSCFSVRTVNVLYAADIRTIADLTKLQKVDVLKLRNAGKGTLSEINDFFEKYGLEWYNG
jgi:DNA-directed RNA polymerase alpha subunit